MILVDIERRYKSLVEIVKMRENQVKAFISFLAEETSWLSAPASTRFHNNFEKEELRGRSCRACLTHMH